MNETDPLMARSLKVISNHQLPKVRPASLAHGSCLCFIPIVFFFAAMDAIWKWWHHEVLKFCIMIGILVMISCLCGFAARGAKLWLFRLGLLLFLATIIGTIAGLFTYYKYMVYYEAYGDMRSYTNVAASQNSDQFADAGFVLFSSDSHVDAARAVGYRDVATATTVCLAPITDGAMEPTTPVSFWAVGTNCCEPRATFNCDGAATGGARAGVLLIDAEVVVSPSMESVVVGLGGFKPTDYDGAMLLSGASWSTSVADHVRFVRWTDDPRGIRDEFRTDGLWQFVWFVVAYLFLSIMFGLLALPSASEAETAKQAELDKAEADLKAANQKEFQEEEKKKEEEEKLLEAAAKA